MSNAEQIATVANRLNITLDDSQLKQLISYAELIEKWNKTYNLSAIKTVDNIINNHIIDSLYVVPFIEPSTVLDVGSGAGLPGLVIAIAKPEISVYLLDSVRKKCHFLHYVKTTLQLTNAHIINERVENTHGILAQQITSRAFASIDKTIVLTRHLLAKGGRYLLMKGEKFSAEKQIIATEKLIIHTLDTQHKMAQTANKRYLIEISV